MKSGTWAWAGLAVYVVLWDLYAVRTGRETLSSAFYKGLHHPVKRWRVVLLWTYITAHLFRWVPDRWDPLRAWGARRQSASQSCP
jgi:hypothetical protein